MNKIIGIDLGTTNTCTGYVSNKIPRVIPIEGGFNLMPSVVSLHKSGTIFVGQAAKEQMITNPERTIHGIKRLLGRQFNTKAVSELQKRVSYKIVAGENGEAAISVGNTIYSTVDIQTKILQQVKRYAEIHLGEEIPDVVIAVPAYYTDHQRVLVKNAGTAAGFNVRRIVNEPTAAALAYGFNRGFDQKILIYDLGGGTFDVSVLELTGNVFQVIATGGDTYLGGSDFDARIIDWIAESFRKQNKTDFIDEPAAIQRVRTAAERAKIELSLLMNTQIVLPALVERRGRPIDLELMLDRDTLNKITRDLVDRTLKVIDNVLTSRNIYKHDIDELILVGGQTRMPLVNEMITNHFGKSTRKGVNPDECVAIGAALLGDSLAKIDAVTLLDAISIPIGIANADGEMQIVINKHQQLPQKAEIEIATQNDNQSQLLVNVFQGEAGPVTKAEYLGSLTYNNIPAMPAGEIKIKLQFNLDTEGLLTINATHNKGDKSELLTLSTIEQQIVPQEINENEVAS
ncbi:MAG: Hsp70 family protein, partial [Deltaproteobacteria bacterium]|nr:Hsp70 family protein [Deltaproteobacteria bacterium]